MHYIFKNIIISPKLKTDWKREVDPTHYFKDSYYKTVGTDWGSSYYSCGDINIKLVDWILDPSKKWNTLKKDYSKGAHAIFICLDANKLSKIDKYIETTNRIIDEYCLEDSFKVIALGKNGTDVDDYIRIARKIYTISENIPQCELQIGEDIPEALENSRELFIRKMLNIVGENCTSPITKHSERIWIKHPVGVYLSGKASYSDQRITKLEFEGKTYEINYQHDKLNFEDIKFPLNRKYLMCKTDPLVGHVWRMQKGNTMGYLMGISPFLTNAFPDIEKIIIDDEMIGKTTKMGDAWGYIKTKDRELNLFGFGGKISCYNEEYVNKKLSKKMVRELGDKWLVEFYNTTEEAAENVKDSVFITKLDEDKMGFSEYISKMLGMEPEFNMVHPETSRFISWILSAMYHL